MTPERDVYEAPQSQTSRDLPAALRDEHARPATQFREINERRARVENTELLRHLRGL